MRGYAASQVYVSCDMIVEEMGGGDVGASNLHQETSMFLCFCLVIFCLCFRDKSRYTLYNINNIDSYLDGG